VALLTLTPPASEPVSLAQMKNFARVDFSDDDELFPILITAAREWCEVYCQRRFILRTMRLLMDFFPGYVDFKLAGQKVSSPFVSGSNAVLAGIRYAIALPYPRVRWVVDFQYQDQNGDVQDMTIGVGTGNYQEDLSSQPARLTPPFGQMWPVARVITNAVQVDYATGYGGNITIGMTASSAAITGTTFYPESVGLSLSVPGAGPSGATLVTTIASVDDEGNGTAANTAATTVTGAVAYLGDPVPYAIQLEIMRLALYYYENRNFSPDKEFINSVKRGLSPYRDLRF